jgi:hypothetical protein
MLKTSCEGLTCFETCFKTCLKYVGNGLNALKMLETCQKNLHVLKCVKKSLNVLEYA